MGSREGMGPGEGEAGQSLDPGDEVNRRQVENPRERPHRLASRLLIPAVKSETPAAFLRQGTQPRINALPGARPRQAHRAEGTRANGPRPRRLPSSRNRALRREGGATSELRLAGNHRNGDCNVTIRSCRRRRLALALSSGRTQAPLPRAP